MDAHLNFARCVAQEIAYSKGWEERMDGHPYPDEPVSRFYAMGWRDADRRERAEAERTNALARDPYPHRPSLQ